MSNNCNNLDYLTKPSNNSNITPALNHGVYFKKKQDNYSSYLDNIDNTKNVFIQEGFQSENISAEDIRNRRSPYFSPENVLTKQTRNVIEANNFSNTETQDSLNQLREEYHETTIKLQDLNARVNGSANNYINRVSSNPYLGKNIAFTDGTICYVTQQGIVKPYTEWDLFINTSGSNGCPGGATNVNMPFPSNATPGTYIPELNLVFGTVMTWGQSCGKEGKNVYVNTPLSEDDSNNKYMGCYSDKDTVGEDIMFVPRFENTNTESGFTSWASSIYLNNNSCGPWAAFDGNINTFWHSEVGSNYNYDGSTGVYNGINGINYIDGNGQTQFAKGEFLGLSCGSEYILTKYDIQGRQDCCGDKTSNGRSPNSWLILGSPDNIGTWEVIDTRENESIGYGMRTYYITTPKKYFHYVFVTTNCGDPSAQGTRHRYCVQISSWNLYTNTTFTSTRTAMTNAGIGNVDYNTCKNHAMQNGFEFYALQQTQQDNTGQCMLSNDMFSATQYGNEERYNMIQLWSSNTAGSGATNMVISSDGRLLLVNPEGTIVWASPFVEWSGCAWGGYVNPNTVEASYGGNCIGKPVGIDCGTPSQETYGTAGIVGNLNGPFREAATKNHNTNAAFTHFSLDGFNGGDPAVCCKKEVTYTYQCGNGPFKNNSVPGTNATFDCTSEVASCKFTLALQTDGNMCIYKDDGTWTGIWCTMTNGQQKDENPNWVSSKGFTGSSTMSTGNTLSQTQWIGNDSGTIRLIMQNDGNLVLYTSEKVVSCRKNAEEKNVGVNFMNALYQFIPTSIMETIGKLGFVDGDSVLYEYPNNNARLSNKYTKVPDTDSAGHDIPGAAFGDSSLEKCQASCNSNQECYGFGYHNPYNVCYPKTNTMYPYGGQTRPFKGFDLYIRNQEPIEPPVGVSNDVENIDTVRYTRYNKTTEPTTKYGLAKETYEEEKELNDLNEKMKGLATKLGDFTTKFGDGTNQMEMQSGRNIKGLDNYQEKKKKIDKKIRKITDTPYEKKNDPFYKFQKQQQQKREQNMMNGKGYNKPVENFTGRNDIKLILENSDIVVLQKNYEYMFWSILAVGTVLVAINIAPKR